VVTVRTTFATLLASLHVWNHRIKSSIRATNTRTRMVLFGAFSLFIVATSASAFTPFTGNWWNKNESGSGYNIEVHQGVLVITIYSYKSNGDSEWYLAAGPMSPDQRQFSGTLDKYRNGQCISCTYEAPTLIGNDGIISITFLSETSATLTLPGGRVVNIEPFFPSSVKANLDGTYQLTRTTVDYLGGALYDTAIGNFAANGTMVIAGSHVTQSITFTVNGTTIPVSISGTFTDFGAFLVFVSEGGAANRAAVIVRGGSVLITEANSPTSGAVPAFAEVDQWALVSSATPMEADDQRAGERRGQINRNGSVAAPLGAAIGATLMMATPQ